MHGYNVLQAVNGADAVDTLEHFGGQMHLVMTDVVMPGMSGGELARKVRELQPGMPVLFISGYTETMVVQYGIEPGSGFLQKPFTLAAMVEKVREMLDRGPSGPSGDQSGAVDG